MSKPELLSMLAAKGIDVNKVPGGIPSLTQMDVAAMLRDCTPCEEALLRAMYVGESMSKAYAYWATHVLEQGWETEKRGRLDLFITATLGELMSNELCRTCGGLRFILDNDKVVPCPAECANGRKSWSSRQMATALDFKTKLHEPWASRVEWGRSALRTWHSDAVRKLRF